MAAILPETVNRVYRLITADQRVRFLITGVINTAVGYGTFAAAVFCGFHYIAAHAASTVVGTTCSYFLNKYFTFRQYRKSLAEVCRFVLVYAVSFILGAAALYVMISLLSVNVYAAGMLKLIITVIISWFGHKYFSFRTDWGGKTR